MVLPIFITFIALIFLIILHELGHFILAKRFGMKIEEFGIGFPPRIFAKKIGKTIYSLNLLPLGAFVKIYGEDKEKKDKDSFSAKPIWQRALVIIGGVVVFWLIAIVLLSFVSAVWGMPTAISDEVEKGIKNPEVKILQVLENYPARKAGFQPLDTILKLKSDFQELKVTKVKEVQNFIKKHKEKEIIIEVLRGKEIKKIKVKPNKEGLIGVSLARTGWQISPWYLAPWTGLKVTGEFTFRIITTLAEVVKRLVTGKKIEGLEVRGPIGIGELFVRAFDIGIGYFIYFVAVISIYLAIFNILPIPAVDGGRLLFLAIEKLRGNPIPRQVEQKINTAFFMFLLLLLIFITLKDLARLF